MTSEGITFRKVNPLTTEAADLVNTVLVDWVAPVGASAVLVLALMNVPWEGAADLVFAAYISLGSSACSRYRMCFF